MANIHPYASRALPYEPGAAKALHEEQALTARALDQEAKREAHRQMMREKGRQLDEEQAELRRQRRRQEDHAYKERFGKQKRHRRKR